MFFSSEIHQGDSDSKGEDTGIEIRLFWCKCKTFIRETYEYPKR